MTGRDGILWDMTRLEGTRRGVVGTRRAVEVVLDFEADADGAREAVEAGQLGLEHSEVLRERGGGGKEREGLGGGGVR